MQKQIKISFVDSIITLVLTLLPAFEVMFNVLYVLLDGFQLAHLEEVCIRAAYGCCSSSIVNLASLGTATRRGMSND